MDSMKRAAVGLVEALEVSAFVDEMRIERMRAGPPRLSRNVAVARVNREDALRELEGPGRRVGWPRASAE